MDVELLYFEDCPNWKVAAGHLDEIAGGRTDITLTRRLVETPQEAERRGFLGSPSILVNGHDAFAEPGAGVGLSCRVYATPDGLAGSPTLDQLRVALGGGR